MPKVTRSPGRAKGVSPRCMFGKSCTRQAVTSNTFRRSSVGAPSSFEEEPTYEVSLCSPTAARAPPCTSHLNVRFTREGPTHGKPLTVQTQTHLSYKKDATLVGVACERCAAIPDKTLVDTGQHVQQCIHPSHTGWKPKQSTPQRSPANPLCNRRLLQ